LLKKSTYLIGNKYYKIDNDKKYGSDYSTGVVTAFPGENFTKVSITAQ
jgi:hypothetical protein